MNYLLQSGAGVLAKYWMVLAHFATSPHKDTHQLAFVHDELQYETTPDYVEDLKYLLEFTAKQAGEHYNLRIPIAAEAKSGKNRAEVH